MAPPGDPFEVIQRHGDIRKMLNSCTLSEAAALLQDRTREPGYTAATWAILMSNHEALSAILDFVRSHDITLKCWENEHGSVNGNLLWVAIQNRSALSEALTTVLDHICLRSIALNCVSSTYPSSSMRSALHFAADNGSLEVFKSSELLKKVSPYTQN